MFGSHNSLTGYKPRKFYHWIFYPFSKCQDKLIDKQIGKVIILDIRVKIISNKKKETLELIPCHGLCEYKINLDEIIKYLNEKHIIFRIVLEDTFAFYSKKNKDMYFKYLCMNFSMSPLCYKIIRKSDWLVYDNPYYIGSKFKEVDMFPNFRKAWYPPIPKLFQKKYPKDKDKELDQTTIYWYDFI